MSVASHSMEQKRAAHALREIHRIRDGEPTKFRSYVDSLPAAIVMNGLGQALATELAQSDGAEPGHRLLFEAVQSWLCSPESRLSFQGNLMEAIINGSQRDYIRAQAETLAYLVWLKKFARAYLPPTED